MSCIYETQGYREMILFAVFFPWFNMPFRDFERMGLKNHLKLPVSPLEQSISSKVLGCWRWPKHQKQRGTDAVCKVPMETIWCVCFRLPTNDLSVRSLLLSPSLSQWNTDKCKLPSLWSSFLLSLCTNPKNNHYPKKNLILKTVRDFLGGPVVRVAFHCRRHGFDSWSGN